jgi:hypothetical protein
MLEEEEEEEIFLNVLKAAISLNDSVRITTFLNGMGYVHVQGYFSFSFLNEEDLLHSEKEAFIDTIFRGMDDSWDQPEIDYWDDQLPRLGVQLNYSIVKGVKTVFAFENSDTVTCSLLESDCQINFHLYTTTASDILSVDDLLIAAIISYNDFVASKERVCEDMLEI